MHLRKPVRFLFEFPAPLDAFFFDIYKIMLANVRKPWRIAVCQAKNAFALADQITYSLM